MVRANYSTALTCEMIQAMGVARNAARNSVPSNDFLHHVSNGVLIATYLILPTTDMNLHPRVVEVTSTPATRGGNADPSLVCDSTRMVTRSMSRRYQFNVDRGTPWRNAQPTNEIKPQTDEDY